METRFNFVIIGCGVISTVHAKAIGGISNATLYGVYDQNYQRAAEFAGSYGCRVFETIEEVFNDGNVDIVNICTHSSSHAELAIAAANSGKHVIVEKPMAINNEDAKAVVATQALNNVKICVVSQLRFSDEIEAARNAIKQGLCGKLVLCSLSMRYYRSSEYYAAGGWRGKWATDGGGALMNQGIHGIDLLCYLCGNIKSVRAFYKTLVHEIETEDTICAAVEFENGALGVIEASTAVKPGYPRRLEVSGSEGSITLTEDVISEWQVKADKPLLSRGSGIDTSSDPSKLDFTGHRMQFENLLAAISGDQQLLVDANEGKKAVDVILAVYRSAQLGDTVLL